MRGDEKVLIINIKTASTQFLRLGSQVGGCRTQTEAEFPCRVCPSLEDASRLVYSV